jgi:hypothetical protein
MSPILQNYIKYSDKIEIVQYFLHKKLKKEKSLIIRQLERILKITASRIK